MIEAVDTEMINGTIELYIKEEFDITNDDEYVREHTGNAQNMEVKLEGTDNSNSGGPEMEVLRVESPQLTDRQLRLNARKKSKLPVASKRKKMVKPKPKYKLPVQDNNKEGSDTEKSGYQIMGCPNRNQFCYICGLFTPPNNSRNLTKNLITAFEEYFVRPYVPIIGLVPEVVCDYCYRSLMGWMNKSERHKMKYVLPVTWLQQSEHIVECCYFCLTKTTGFRYSTRAKISYPDVNTVIKARVRCEQYPTAASEETTSENKETSEQSDQAKPRETDTTLSPAEETPIVGEVLPK